MSAGFRISLNTVGFASQSFLTKSFFYLGHQFSTLWQLSFIKFDSRKFLCDKNGYKTSLYWHKSAFVMDG